MARTSSEEIPNTDSICILCDGGGFNACSHHVVKQSLLKLASTIGVTSLCFIINKYCSNYNPIDHCMFGPISRNWNRATLLSIENARAIAEATTTKKGLSIISYNKSKNV
uniref:ISAzo13-like element transposase-related protein n=1 Tax=Alloprevotella sp. TaxID=1872471 RepID=UPI004028AB0B